MGEIIKLQKIPRASNKIKKTLDQNLTPKKLLCNVKQSLYSQNYMPAYTGTITNLQIEGWRMVKSETRRDAEILVRNPSPRLLGEKFRDSKKVKTNHEKNDTPRLIKNISDISRSCQNFPRPTFFKVPFATPRLF